MARYIDADNFRKTMIKRFGCIPCLTDYSEASRRDIPIDDALNLEPTADVVPRAEVDVWKQERFNIFQRLEFYEMTRQKVAREIFEEIEHETKNHGICYTQRKISELKKKYTEGGKE